MRAFLRSPRAHSLDASLRVPGVGLLVACVAAACGDTSPVPEPGTSAESDTGPSGRPIEARYVTTLAFAADEGPMLFASFWNESGPERLARRYGAWLRDDGGWTRLLQVEDTLPVPRAAWRLLPTDSLRLAVGDGGELVSLAFGRGPETVRLRAGEEIGRWTGTTGQREALGMALLQAGGRQLPGVLFFRRAARSLDAPSPDIRERIFLLADSLGNGLLLQADDSPGGTVAARTWLHGGLATWTDVRLVEDPDSVTLREGGPRGRALEPRPRLSTPDDSPPSTWSFEITQAGLRGRLQRVGDGPPGQADAVARSGERAFRVRGELFVDDQVFLFEGLGLELPLP